MSTAAGGKDIRVTGDGRAIGQRGYWESPSPSSKHKYPPPPKCNSNIERTGVSKHPIEQRLNVCGALNQPGAIRCARKASLPLGESLPRMRRRPAMRKAIFIGEGYPLKVLIVSR
ncbi:uncharacterized protein LOC144456202 [Phascolarctos cinereus]